MAIHLEKGGKRAVESGRGISSLRVSSQSYCEMTVTKI